MSMTTEEVWKMVDFLNDMGLKIAALGLAVAEMEANETTI